MFISQLPVDGLTFIIESDVFMFSKFVLADSGTEVPFERVMLIPIPDFGGVMFSWICCAEIEFVPLVIL